MHETGLCAAAKQPTVGENETRPLPGMNFLFLLSTCCFIGSLSLRLLDPVVPEVARDLSTTPEAVALLSTAFLITYAITQPFVGAVADAYGKVRIIKICSAALSLMLVLMAIAPTIEVLYLARIMGGVFGGGIFTVALAIVGDRVAVERRQVALSNLIMASQLAQLFGVIAAGFIAAYYGWRVAVGVAAIVAIAATLMLARNLQPRPGVVRYPFNLGRIVSTLTELSRNRRATTCWTGVLFDGMAVTGLTPFIAVLLEQSGRGGLREAGFVIGGLACGALLYTFSVRFLLMLVGGPFNMLRFGGVISAIGLAGLAHGGPWPLQMLEMVITGCGFFMVHASLQAQATDVPAELRSVSVSMHSSFFTLGSGIGPAVYAVGINMIGAKISILIGALVMLMVGLFAAARLEAILVTESTSPGSSPAAR
jgi:predicted MFS family arabinose efflux permease